MNYIKQLAQRASNYIKQPQIDRRKIPPQGNNGVGTANAMSPTPNS